MQRGRQRVDAANVATHGSLEADLLQLSGQASGDSQS